jgi:putative transposase
VKKPVKKQKTAKTKEPVGKVKKIRIYPNKDQKQLLSKWFGTTRWTYNKCLEGIEKEKIAKKKKELRAYCINKSAMTETEQWVLETPYDIRNEAMADLLKAYKTCYSKKEKFTMKYKSKKALSDSLVIHSKHYKHNKGPYASLLKNLKSAEKLPDRIYYDARLQKKRLLGEYYLIIPEAAALIPDNQGNVNETLSPTSVIALDPGVRTFMTGYCPDGIVIEWARNDIKKIDRLCFHIDALQSKISQKKWKYKQRRSMRKAAARMRKRITSLIDEVQWKLVKHLCQSYKVVLLPDFQISGMVKRSKRNISKKTARNLYTWSYYKFKSRLLTKAKEYIGRSIIICDEHYTSKTCGRCGLLNMALKRKKIFVCEKCGLETDRDVNAARNILLRYMSVNHIID